jgi:transcriptional antiterminator
MDIRIIILLHKLLLAERTGGPKELALKLALSERSIYNYIGFMKTELNAPIIYQVQKRELLLRASVCVNLILTDENSIGICRISISFE